MNLTIWDLNIYIKKKKIKAHDSDTTLNLDIWLSKMWK